MKIQKFFRRVSKDVLSSPYSALTVGVLAGVIIGFMISPVKRGIEIKTLSGNFSPKNSGNPQGSGNTKAGNKQDKKAAKKKCCKKSRQRFFKPVAAEDAMQ